MGICPVHLRMVLVFTYFLTGSGSCIVRNSFYEHATFLSKINKHSFFNKRTIPPARKHRAFSATSTFLSCRFYVNLFTMYVKKTVANVVS